MRYHIAYSVYAVMFNACVQMFVARFYMAVYFGELCKITFVDKWTYKMVKKKDG